VIIVCIYLPPALERMSISNRFVKEVDGFITLGHKIAGFIVRVFDKWNGSTPSKKEVSDNEDGSLYDIFREENIDEVNPAFVDEAVIEFFPKKNEI
jgi:hypothetical protein